MAWSPIQPGPRADSESAWVGISIVADDSTAKTASCRIPLIFLDSLMKPALRCSAVPYLPVSLTFPDGPVSMTIPIELWSSVFVYSSKRDLQQLCTVSRTFHREAERVLYREVSLYGAKLHLWAQRVSQRSDLAAHVRAVTLTISLYHETSQDHLHTIHQALRALENLQELSLHGSPDGPHLNPSHVWILSNCSFQLKVFRNSLFDLSPLVWFLATQSGIQTWEQQIAIDFNFVDDILPNLISVSAPSWLVAKLQSPRPIQEISFILSLLGKDGELAAISTMGKYSKTLTHLRVERMVSENSLLLEHFISHLAEATPRLKHLSINNTGASVCKPYFSGRTIILT